MQQSEYFLAKVGFNLAENEQLFSKIGNDWRNFEKMHFVAKID